MELIGRYNALITKICFYFTSNSSDFDDLRQDVLLNLWRGLHTFRGESSEMTWVYRVCFNTCVSSVRRNSRHTMPSLDEVPESNTVAESEGKDDDIQLLHRAISQLAPTDRSMVLMQLDGNSYDEIAEVMGMNRNTVATRLKRSRERLARIINQLRD